MSPNEPAASEGAEAEDDPRVLRAVEEYLAARQAGAAPDRHAFLARHADVAAALAECLDGLDFLHQAGAPLRPSAEADTAAAPGAPLGDFRLLREVGRGGMGVVYEAEQLSLGRRVALKVLPLAAALDARQLQRFQNEARAAACLHHTHIVPVYGVGSERGVHFYAMQFIDGRTLADLIRQLRRQAGGGGEEGGRTGGLAEELPSGRWAPSPRPTAASEPAGPYTPPAGDVYRSTAEAPRSPLPTTAAASPSGAGFLRSAGFFRTVAELGIQAAEALEHAHQLGVVHRDVKPGNLLLDGHGQLWVTDFGLAHVQSQTALTFSGDLVGTLRYMSPEQALARRAPLDHRTDIYALGATLYELLTLEPVVHGQDRQEVLRQIAFDEPRRPRQLNRAVPPELETIVTKAIEKNPADRYATAQELADDLERFLKDEPIRARRPTLVRRARKWARRHRALVWSAAVVLLLAVLMAGINGLWLAQKRAATAGAVAAVLKEARDLRDKEKWPEALAAAGRAEAVLQLGGGGDGLRQQVQELLRDLEMVRRLEEARLQRAAGVKGGAFDWEASDAAYARAFGWYGLEVESLEPKEAAERIRSCPIRLQLAAALDDWAAAQRALGLEGWRRVVAVSRAADPDRWRDRLRDALEGNDTKALQEVAASVPDENLPPATAVLLGRLSLGTGAAEKAVAVLEKVWQRHPGDFWVNEELGLCLHGLQPPRPQEALPYYRAAVALRPLSPGARMNLGNALGDQGRLNEAIAEYREALRLKPDYPEAHNNLGAALYRKGRLDDALAEYREALRLNRDLLAAHKNLGAALYAKGELDGAIAEYREALRIKKDDPEAHYNLGNALKAKGRLREAIGEYLQAGGFRHKRNFPETAPAWHQHAQPIAIQQPTGPQSPSRPDEDQEKYEKSVTQELERLLARLRAAPSEREKQRLERAIVDFVRGELRGTWLAPHFTLEAVDTRKNTIRVTIAGTTLMADGLPLAKDARVWIDGQEGRTADLRAGMGVALQLGGAKEQPRVVGVRAGKGPAGPAAAEVDRLIGQLGSEKFAEREAASRALAALGKAAMAALKRAAASGDAEVRSRAGKLLQPLQHEEGTWYCSATHEAPPDPSQKCSIVEADGKLYLINEHGDQTEARVLLGRDRIEVVAFSWGGMKGRVEMDGAGTRIKWPNGTKWTQKRP
jgi:serine/threonine protein kinase/Flp pilus assembly protein TadD